MAKKKRQSVATTKSSTAATDATINKTHIKVISEQNPDSNPAPLVTNNIDADAQGEDKPSNSTKNNIKEENITTNIATNTNYNDADSDKENRPNNSTNNNKNTENTTTNVDTKKDASNNTDATSTPLLRKRNGRSSNLMSSARNKRKKKSPTASGAAMRVEGYAFKDDIIGVRHLKADGEDAFNLTLKNMVVNDELTDQGFSAFVTLRDIDSGKNDEPLRGTDGYPQFMFLSMDRFHFGTAEDAQPAVEEQCKMLRKIASDPVQNIFGYKYDPVTKLSNKTSDNLLVLSDVVRYSDALRILKYSYGDPTYQHTLEPNFALNNPDIMDNYFTNLDEIPDHIREELGL